jgi:hypothetical protein
VISVSIADTVVVSNPMVSIPVSARYAYSGDPAGNNLVNSAGLPASPIREESPVPGGPVCGDLSCDPGEDSCNCNADCGPPPATELACDDGVDDCDGRCDGNP